MIRALTNDEMAELTACSTEAGFGAIDTEKGCLPLRALDVDVRVEGLMARTAVRQQFANVFDEPLEATYIFPLPPRAAVTGFTMAVAGGTIIGRIEERAKARRDYYAAIAEGRRAAIAEEERPDVFTLRVGNIPPRSIARVEFTLVAPVPIDSLEATYRFPLVVAPRYCPGTPLDGASVGDGIGFDTDLVPDASRISPPILLPGMKSPVRLGIRVSLAASSVGGRPGDDAEAFSCSLPAEETRDEATWTIRVVPGQRLDRDFILRWKIGGNDVPATSAVTESDAARSAGLGSGQAVKEAPGDGTFAVTIVPPTAPPPCEIPRDVVVVLDRSGSMGGWKIAAARRAVARLVDSLTERDRVAVLAFDDVIEHRGLAPTLEAATDRGRWQVLEWLATVDERGGTELGAALAAGLELCGTGPANLTVDASRRERFVVLVTDGQVGDEDRVLRSLEGRLGDTRLFVVGIDTAINEGLLARLADASGGLVELVENEERLDEVMQRIHARIAVPLVTGLTVAGEGIEVVPGSLVPSRMPDLVPGLPIVLRGRYRRAGAGARIRIDGRDARGAAWRAFATVLPAAAEGQGSLWARGRLRSLEDELATSRRGRRSSAIEKRIVALSTSFGVLCRFTAVVAIDDREPDRRLLPLAPRRIMTPVEGRLYSACLMRYVAPMMPSQPAPHITDPSCAPDVFDDGLCCDFGFEGAAMPVPPTERLDEAHATALRLIEAAEPRRGGVGGVGPAAVRALLADTRLLLMRLIGSGIPAPRVLAMIVAQGRLEQAPTDRAALVALLDALAAFVEEDSRARLTRWWVTVGVDAGPG